MSSLNESIGIRPIYIRFTTNDNPSNETILTRDMIYIPSENKEREENIVQDINDQKGVEKKTNEDEELSKYPFFTDSVRFPTPSILKLSREDQLKLFFSKTFFKQKIGHKTNVDDDVRNDNAEYNLKALLNILLPTSFPIKNNIYETFSGNIKNIIIPSDFASDSNIFEMLFSDIENKYGYLNINGRNWTVVKINLINDLINDKTFSSLIQSGSYFQKWKELKLTNYKKNVEELEQEISDIIKDKLPNIQKTLTPDPTKKDAQQNEAVKARLALNKGFGNQPGVRIPTRFLTPLINSLITTTDMQEIITLFNKMQNLRIKSGAERKEFYIPLAIMKIDGISDLLKKSSEYTLKKNIIDNLTSLKKIYEIIKNKQEDKNENPAIDELLKNKELKAFLDEVIKYRPPNRNYTNKLLTETLENIDVNINNFLEFIDFINKIKIEGERPKEEILSNEQMTDRLKTGLMIVSESNIQDEKKDILGLNTNFHYDCLVNFQLIDGLVNDDNLDDVKCPYRNQMLDIQYKNLKYADEKNPVLFYIDSKPFDMGKTQKGGRNYNKTKKRRSIQKKKGGFVGRTIKSISNSLSNVKKGKRKGKKYSKQTDRIFVTPYN
tara:strand:- start:195 stop:2018 length:1824 start_codon:yes stop_codon:yes gene_type:complete